MGTSSKIKMYWILNLAITGSIVVNIVNGDTCSRIDKNGVSTFTLRAEAPQLLKPGEEMNIILIQFDTVRKLPISSTIFIDKLNQIKAVNRSFESFGPLPCSELPVMTRQQNCSIGYSMTQSQLAKAKPRWTWDRGHLTPVNPMRFSEDAVRKTFYCVNIAPQDSYTNQKPWKNVELKVESKLRRIDGAFVQTGLCSEDNMVDGPLTYRGWRIPNCFWKLICYKDSEGGVQVVGFIGQNTLISNEKGEQNRQAQAVRFEETLTPRSQAEVLELVSRPTLIARAWSTASRRLLPQRKVVKTKVPSANECAATLSLPTKVVAEWSR